MHEITRTIIALAFQPPDILLGLYFAYQWCKEGVENL